MFGYKKHVVVTELFRYTARLFCTPILYKHLMKPLFATSIILVGLLPIRVLGQTATTDTTFLNHAITKATEIYEQAIGGQAHLFNGTAYKEIIRHNSDEGHPYFLSDDWLEGSVQYDRGTYHNISMQYDLVKDKLVIEHPYSHSKLELITEKLDGFNISGHHFINIHGDSSNQASLRPGVYELLYDGHVKVYANYRKEIQQVLELQQIRFIFDEKTQFYIYKQGNYYPVKNKSSVLKVFADRKSVIRKQLKKNKISFNKNQNQAIVESARFYDESEIQP